MDQIIKLKHSFKKNDLQYEMIKRSEKFVLYKLVDAGYELCEIKIQQAKTFNGINYKYRERLPSNEEFGKDRSMSFFIQQYEYAMFCIETLIKYPDTKKSYLRTFRNKF